MRDIAIPVVLGWVLLWMSCTHAAAQAAPQGQEVEAGDEKYRHALQEIERLKNELDNARREIETLKKQRAGSVEAAQAADFFQAGNTYIGAKQYQEAVTAFTRAIELAPRAAIGYRNRGIAQAHLGNSQPALDDFNTALELDPRDAVTYNQRGIIYYTLDKPQQAWRDFTKAIELDAKLAEAYNNRGIVSRRLGNYAQASKDFTSAAQLGMELASHHLQVLRDEIRQVQERLQQAGLNPGPADGIPGQQTTAALRQYQNTRGLPVTGWLDDATRQALGVVPSAAASAPPQAPAESLPRFVHQPKPEYPVQARQQGWEGAVTLQLEMRADGTIGEARVVKSSGHNVLDTAAQEVAKTWTHVPAMHNGVAVTQWVTLNLTFTLDKESEAGAANRKPAQDQ